MGHFLIEDMKFRYQSWNFQPDISHIYAFFTIFKKFNIGLEKVHIFHPISQKGAKIT